MSVTKAVHRTVLQLTLMYKADEWNYKSQGTLFSLSITKSKLLNVYNFILNI